MPKKNTSTGSKPTKKNKEPKASVVKDVPVAPETTDTVDNPEKSSSVRIRHSGL